MADGSIPWTARRRLAGGGYCPGPDKGGWYSAEYLPQLAAYVDAILHLRYPPGQVLFELPASALQLDLAILDDNGRVVVLGEATRDALMLGTLRRKVELGYAEAPPDMSESKSEARQLAWRLWTVAPDYTWLIGPNRRSAFLTSSSPLRLEPTRDGRLPAAEALGLAGAPPTEMMTPPRLLPYWVCPISRVIEAREKRTLMPMSGCRIRRPLGHVRRGSSAERGDAGADL